MARGVALVALIISLSVLPTPGISYAPSLVGSWTVEESNPPDPNRLFPQPWGRGFNVLRDSTDLAVQFNGDTVMVFQLDGRPVTTKDSRGGTAIETITKATRTPTRILIETQTGQYSSETTLSLSSDKLVIARGVGGRGSVSSQATYLRR